MGSACPAWKGSVPCDPISSVFYAANAQNAEHGHTGQGMGLGQCNTTTDIVQWRSFIHLGVLFPEQSGQPAAMDHDRRWFDLSPGQRMELYDRARDMEQGKQLRAA